MPPCPASELLILNRTLTMLSVHAGWVEVLRQIVGTEGPFSSGAAGDLSNPSLKAAAHV